jgi:hypothetical protein
VLQIFIALKNPSSSAGFELVNLGFSGKHDNITSLRTTVVSLLLFRNPGMLNFIGTNNCESYNFILVINFHKRVIQHDPHHSLESLFHITYIYLTFLLVMKFFSLPCDSISADTFVFPTPHVTLLAQFTSIRQVPINPEFILKCRANQKDRIIISEHSYFVVIQLFFINLSCVHKYT